MNESQIKVLVGKNDGAALDIGRILSSNGADVNYSHCDPLQIQFDVLRKQPDALILSSLTRHTAKLCSLLKKSEHAPYIVLISEGSENSSDKEIEGADLILDNKDKMLFDKLFSRLFKNKAPAGVQLTSASLETLISDTLFNLCITKNYNGYAFLSDAIALAAESDTIARCISKDIYPDIAKKYNVSVCSVERNIRTVIHSSWAKSGRSVKKEYFGTFALDDRWVPTNSQFIFIIADRLSKKRSIRI